MNELTVSREFSFPLDLVVQQVGILARTGAGKTNTAVVIAEEVLAAGEQCVILDPPGAWWGLRSSSDGKKPGFPIVVLGGDHGDLPLEATAGKEIADFVVDERASVILDLSEFSGRELSSFVTAFAERLYHRKGKERSAMLLIIEESDEVAPQRPMPDQTRMLGAIERIVKRGRMRGIGTLLITQRSASLNKNVLTQIGTLIAMQTTAPQDIKAIDEWVERTGDQARRKELLNEIAELPIGTAFVWSPAWLRTFRKVAFRRRRTFDSSATPKPGQSATGPKKVADVDLECLREKMAATIEKAKAEDPRELRRRILELERQAKNAGQTREPERIVERIEVPVLTREQQEALSAYVNAIQDWGGKMISTGNEVIAALGRLQGQERPRMTERPKAPAPRPPARREERSEPSGDFTLRKGERLMLEVLARHHPMRVTRAQLGTLSKFSPRGGTFNTYFGTLKRNGLIFEEGGEVQLTEKGMAEVGHVPASPQTAEELQSMWRSALRAGEATMLDELISIYPASIGREDLGERTGYTASGGTFGTYLGTLRRNGLIEERGREVRASDTLFLAERTSA